MEMILKFLPPSVLPPVQKVVHVVFEYQDGTRVFIDGEYTLGRWLTAQYNMSSGYIEMIPLEKGEKILGWCDIDNFLKTFPQQKRFE